MLQLTEVSKVYGNQYALRDISLAVPLGKIVGIVGANGSGKSTLLRLMAGLSLPTSGRVTVGGETARRRIGRMVSYLPEGGSFYSMFTVGEAMDFQASQFADFNRGRADEILAFMRLEPGLFIKDLSKGHRSRFKIALSLAREAPYILMDEPLSGLDPMVRETIVAGMLSFLNLETQTLIMTSHEIAEIEALLDEFIAIKDGTLLRMTEVAELHETEGMGIAEWMKKTYI